MDLFRIVLLLQEGKKRYQNVIAFCAIKYYAKEKFKKNLRAYMAN